VTEGREFRLAPMTWDLAILTLVLLPLPLLVGVVGPVALVGHPPAWLSSVLHGAGYFVLAIYFWIWCWSRPTRFVVGHESIEIVWPLRTHTLALSGVMAARMIDRKQLRDEVGWGMRVGAGGLWGAFGYLWTAKRGLVRMYISRTDRFVWIEQGEGQPWLITPDEPEAFLRAIGK
jgi:hypothetical protein